MKNHNLTPVTVPSPPAISGGSEAPLGGTSYTEGKKMKTALMAELTPWQFHNSRGLTANDHIDRLRVTHPDIAASIAKAVNGLVDAMQAAYVELHKAEYVSQLKGDYSPSTSKPLLKAAAADAGYALQPWDGK